MDELMPIQAGNAQPLLSVSLITYNHENFIRESLEGIVKQTTNFPFELVIGDDCSTDKTRNICDEYAQRYPAMIKLLPAERNLGIMPNLKRTLDACTGKYIALCEGDDYWVDPLKLQKQVDFLESHSDFVACFHDVKVVDASGNLVRKSKGRLSQRDLSQEELVRGRVMALLSLCYRNVIREYPPEMFQVLAADKFLCSLLGQFGKGKFLDNVEPAAYRLHSGGVWSPKKNTQKKMSIILSNFWMWQYYNRIKNEEVALYYFNMILREGFFSKPSDIANASWFDKLEYALVTNLRVLFRIVRRLLRIR